MVYCSFCSKSQDEVRKIIAGPSVFICDECVMACLSIMVYPNPELDRTEQRLTAEYGRIHQW